MLNGRQKQFIQALRDGLSPKEAYLHAGYSERTVGSGVKRLCALPEVKEILEWREEQTESGEAEGIGRSQVADSAEILRYLTALLRSESGSERERLRAAELLGKRNGIFNEKAESESVGVMIVDDLDG